jgi:AraC-like DNA-binding protein
MNPRIFLAQQNVRELLYRVARSASAPLSVHHYEGDRCRNVFSCNACEMCRWINDSRTGSEKCQRSRAESAPLVKERNRPIAAVCHAGFAYVSFPLIPGGDYIVTVGPFSPPGTPDFLPDIVLENLNRWVKPLLQQIPVALDDVARIKPESVVTITEWAQAELHALWYRYTGMPDHDADERREVHEPGIPETGITGSPARARRRKTQPSSDAQAIAAALAMQNTAEVRALVQRHLERNRRKRKVILEQRAHTLALVSRVLEVSAERGLDVTDGWAAYAQAVPKIRGAADVQELIRICLSVFRALQKKWRSQSPRLRYKALTNLLRERLPERVPLTEAAHALGLSPSALSQRLRRKFGLNYSRYLAHIRMIHARELLRRTQLPIVEVARRCGIRDAANFAKVFKQCTGVSPTEYRELCRNRHK